MSPQQKVSSSATGTADCRAVDYEQCQHTIIGEIFGRKTLKEVIDVYLSKIPLFLVLTSLPCQNLPIMDSHGIHGKCTTVSIEKMDFDSCKRAQKEEIEL